MRLFALFCFMICSGMAMPWMVYPTEKNICYQACQVSLPDHRIDNEWIFETYPGYCHLQKISKSSINRLYDSCINTGNINYCSNSQHLFIDHAIHKKVPDANWIIYSCSVFNATTGSFFYSGSVWPEYVHCSDPKQLY